MNVKWVDSARSDVLTLLPSLAFRRELRQKLRNLQWVGQGMRSTNERYRGCYFIHYRQWIVMYYPVSDDTIAVLGIEYLY